ncbi:type II toxin-antitoxin system RelE family toxin [Aliicoccus persicus]|uniref:mRNA interferase RelE/StbE n=1 Tax=Aliicoccus persicus TaxID=930138 RepID=A0A662Z3U0_9STAP|nr:addiction module toxin RelE [Aliicoccus persicus]SEV86347.1 mRNA interferase RelE/StbE [Aliicoccus persicus]
MYQVRFTNYSSDDFRKLDGSMKVPVLKGLKRIEQRGMQAGEPLRGSLSHCRKIKMRTTGLRIVFRQIDGGIEIIEIIAIGKRDNSDVYKKAIKRLSE